MADQENQGGGSGTQPARPAYESQLGKSLRDNAELMKALPATLNELAEGYYSNQRKLGRSIIIPDPENPDPEERKALFEKMGIPTKAEGYELNSEAFKDLPGIEELAKAVRAHAAEMSLTKSQAQKYLEKVAGIAAEGHKQATAAAKELEDTFEARLLDAVGKDETKKTAAINLSKAGLVRFFGKPQVLVKLKDSGLLYDTDFIMSMAAIQEAMGEAPHVQGSGPGKQKTPPRGAMGNYSRQWEEQHGQNRKG